jgi:hypothetical protein
VGSASILKDAKGRHSSGGRTSTRAFGHLGEGDTFLEVDLSPRLPAPA